jgi:hypothetical protein
MFLPQVLVGCILILLTIAAAWIIFRAARTYGFLWGFKRLLGVAALAGLLVLGVVVWVWRQRSIPQHVTVEKVQAAYATPLEELRRIASDRDLEELASWGTGKTPPWEALADRLPTLAHRPEILQASFLLPANRVIPAYHQPGLGGHAWASSEEAETGLARGWYHKSLWDWSPLHTIEYFESVADGSGKTVQLQLTLRLEALSEDS